MTVASEAPIRVTLPDGSVRELEAGTTGAALAAAIGAGLARASVAIRVNGEIRDLARPLVDGDQVAILTERDADALPVLRHSAAHILATAVRKIFPGAGIGFGPAIDEGFYYDFDVPRPFTPEDLEALEAAMAEVVAADYPFVREVVSREEANARFADDPLKLERISELGPDETITIYTDGPFVDLCRGPHVPSTAKLEALQAAHRRRRLLARRLVAADAAADLRHGLLQEGRAGPAPLPARGVEEARPPDARQTARPLHVPPVRAGRRLLDREGDGDLQRAERLHARRCSGTATARSGRRSSSTRGCGRSPGTGASTRRTCSSSSTTSRASMTSR
ncbi:MAG: TGS domain-containing protein [Gemmatimonadales bacterium]